MHMHLMNGGGLNALIAGLRTWDDGVYVAGEECLDTLEELNNKLNDDDMIRQPFLRQLAVTGIIEKDLVPLRCEPKDDLQVFRSALQLLVSLTQPLDFHTSNKAESLEECLPMKRDNGMYDLSDDEIQLINQFFLLLRNILHINDGGNAGENVAISNTHIYLLKLLFESGISEVILHVLTLRQRDQWGSTVTQLISLLYKDLVVQIFEHLGEQTSLCADGSSHSECSQCDTRMDEQHGRLGSSSSSSSSSDADLSKLDEKLNSQDNSEESYKVTRQECTSPLVCLTLSKSFAASCYIDYKEINSNSSGSYCSLCEICQQNSLAGYSASDLQQQSKANLQYVGAIVTHFTAQFFKNAYSNLLQILKKILMSQHPTDLDESYFLWAVAFFLKFARKKEIDFKSIRDVFTPDVFGFVVFVAISNAEQILVAQRQQKCTLLNMRRLHLSVTSLRQLFKTLSWHKGRQLNEEDSNHLQTLERNLANMTDLRQLFLWLLHHQVEGVHTSLYKREVVVTNHFFLLLLEEWIGKNYCPRNVQMLDHVKQFATLGVMKSYGDLLQNFQKNDEQLNCCLFTMMHHVAGDCGQADTLLQVHIIKAFHEIKDCEYSITQEMNDLIEYIIQRFMSWVEENPLARAIHLFVDTKADGEVSSLLVDVEEKEEPNVSVWYEEEEDKLIEWYNELEGDRQMAEKIVQLFNDMGIKKTKLQVVNKFVSIGWLSQEELEFLTEAELSDPQMEVAPGKSTAEQKQTEEEEEEERAHSTVMSELAGLEIYQVVSYCLEKIEDKGKITWVQEMLIELAYLKLDAGKITKDNSSAPAAMFYLGKDLDIPLLSFSEKQEDDLDDPYVHVLLQLTGFEMPDETGLLFPRISNRFTSYELLKKAEALGDLSNVAMKFDPAHIKPLESSVTQDMTNTTSNASSEIQQTKQYRKLMEGISRTMWVNLVQNYNSSYVTPKRTEELMEGMEEAWKLSTHSNLSNIF